MVIDNAEEGMEARSKTAYSGELGQMLSTKGFAVKSRIFCRYLIPGKKTNLHIFMDKNQHIIIMSTIFICNIGLLMRRMAFLGDNILLSTSK